MDKHLLRADFLKRRDKLSKDVVKLKSHQVFRNFLTLSEILKNDKFLLYLPTRNEVDTSQLIEFLRGRNKKIFLPVFDKKSGGYKISSYSIGADLEPGPYKIVQPVNLQIIDINDVDVAIIPGVVFGKTGARLGYGKGVYDKLLVGFRGLKIALAYDFQIVDKLAQEEHDLKMDMVVTEVRIYGL